MPPVSAPSPTTAITLRSSASPRRAKALAMPWAYDSAVEAWLFSIQSCSDSARFG